MKSASSGAWRLNSLRTVGTDQTNIPAFQRKLSFRTKVVGQFGSSAFRGKRTTRKMSFGAGPPCSGCRRAFFRCSRIRDKAQVGLIPIVTSAPVSSASAGSPSASSFETPPDP